MAIAYLGSGTLGYATGSGSITVPVGTKILLVWTVNDGANDAAGTIGGNALSVRASTLFYYSEAAGSRLLYRVNPPTGSQTLSVTASGLGFVFWAAYDEVDTTTPFIGTDETSNGTAEGTTDPAGTVSSAVGRTVVMFIAALSGEGNLTGFTAAGDSTLRFSTANSGLAGALVEEAGAASVTINANDTGTDAYYSWGRIITQLNPAAGGGSTNAPRATTQRRMRMAA